MLARHRVAVVVAAAIAIPGVTVGATDPLLERQKQVLAEIRASADHFCMPVSPKTETKELSARAQVNLRGLVGRLVGLGLVGEAGGKSVTSNGVLQKDLANAMRQRDTCKLSVLEMLRKDMMPVVEPPRRPAPPPSHRPPIGSSPPTVTPPPPPARPSVSVQFYPTRTNGDFKDIEVEPCVQTDRTLVCTIFVTQTGGRGPSWMAYPQSTIQDENGVETKASLITVGGVSHDPRRGGKRIPLTHGTRTRVVYVYDGVVDATKLQTFNLTVCCTHNISLHPQ